LIDDFEKTSTIKKETSLISNEYDDLGVIRRMIPPRTSSLKNDVWCKYINKFEALISQGRARKYRASKLMHHEIKDELAQNFKCHLYLSATGSYGYLVTTSPSHQYNLRLQNYNVSI
jgi:hypothetical protein